MQDNQICVLLVDDHPVLRDGLRVLLEAETDMQVVGEAANGNEAIDLAIRLEPDVMVVDLGLPDVSGFEVIQQIRSHFGKSGPAIVVLSMHTRREFVVKAIEAGSEGYVPKSSTHVSLLDAIRVVHAGERYIHPAAASTLFESSDDSQEKQRFAKLTDREQEVIRLSVMGYTSREIGEKLIISPKTVDTYRQRALEKLGIEHRSNLIRFAVKIGMLDDLKDSEKKEN
jgi:two-component system response regulator NreC